MRAILNTRAKRVEAILITITAGAAFFAHGILPARLKIGEMVMALAIVLFVQTLIVDLCRGRFLRGKTNLAQRALAGSGPDSPDSATADACDAGRKNQCMCAESALGLMLLCIGFAILIIPDTARYVGIGPWFWPLIVIAGGALGLALRDYMYDSSTSRLCCRPGARG